MERLNKIIFIFLILLLISGCSTICSLCKCKQIPIHIMKRPKLTEVTAKLCHDGKYYCVNPGDLDRLLDNESYLMKVIMFYEFQAKRINALSREKANNK